MPQRSEPRDRSPGVQEQLRAAEQRDRLTGRLDGDLRVPDLGGAAGVGPLRDACEGAVQGGAEEVRLQLDRGEADRTVRTIRERPVAATGVGEGDHRAGVEEAVRSEQMLHDVETRPDLAGLDVDDL